jgi:hypothetical protein
MIQGFIRSHGEEREAMSGLGQGDDGMATALAQDYPNLDAASLRPGKRKRPSRPRSKRGKNGPSSGR